MSTSQYVFSSSINELPFSVGCIILTSMTVLTSYAKEGGMMRYLLRRLVVPP